MKNSTCVYLIPTSPVFNQDVIPKFADFNKEFTSLFYSSLYVNLIDILVSNKSLDIILCLDNQDKTANYNVLNEFFNNSSLYFIDTTDIKNEINVLFEKTSPEYSNNIVLRANQIGLRAADIKKIINLLNIDDEIIVIGKTLNKKVNFVGFNTYDETLFNNLNFKNYSYETFLKKTCELNRQLFVLDNFFTIEHLSDFKHLYKILSKKENYDLCSQKIHEQLTKIFIEYKELL